MSANYSHLKISKYMCYLLRHDPNFVDNEEGWVLIDRLINKIMKKSKEYDPEILKQHILKIVDNDSKRRFSILNNNDKIYIRCNYGHSNISVNISYDNNIPPLYLYHGTTQENYEKILESGYISKMDRSHIHLTDDIYIAIENGKRYNSSSPVVIVINAYEMYKNGYSFNNDEGSIWLFKDNINKSNFQSIVSTEICNYLLDERIIIAKNICNNIPSKEEIPYKSTVNYVYEKLKEFVESGKGDYSFSYSGSMNSYLYMIPDLKVVTLDTDDTIFSEYFDDE